MRVVSPSAPRPYALARFDGPVAINVVTGSGAVVSESNVFSVRGYKSDGTVRFYGRRGKRLLTFSVLRGHYARFVSVTALVVTQYEDDNGPVARSVHMHEDEINKVVEYVKA